MGLDDDDEDDDDDEWQALLKTSAPVVKEGTAEGTEQGSAQETPADERLEIEMEVAVDGEAQAEAEGGAEADVDCEGEVEEDVALDEAADGWAGDAVPAEEVGTQEVVDEVAEEQEAEGGPDAPKMLVGNFEISDEEEDDALDAEAVDEAEEADAEVGDAGADTGAAVENEAKVAKAAVAGKAPVAKQPPGNQPAVAKPPIAKRQPCAPGAGTIQVPKASIPKRPPGAGGAGAAQVRPGGGVPAAFTQPGPRPQAFHQVAGKPATLAKGAGKAQHPRPFACGKGPRGPPTASPHGKGGARGNRLEAAIAAANKARTRVQAAGGSSAGAQAGGGAGNAAALSGEQRTELMRKANLRALKSLQGLSEEELQQRLPSIRSQYFQKYLRKATGGEGLASTTTPAGQSQPAGGKGKGAKGGKKGKGGRAQYLEAGVTRTQQEQAWPTSNNNRGQVRRRDSNQEIQEGTKRRKAKTDPQGRVYDFTTVVVNMANVGATFSKKVRGKKDGEGGLFDWDGVRRCLNFLKYERELKVIGVLNENFRGPDRGSKQQKTMPSDIEELCETVEETPRLTGSCHSSADDEMTIKCAYRRNCRFLDNDNYRDWLQQLRDEKIRTWLNHVQDLLQMRYYFDKGLGTFELLEGNVPEHMLADGRRDVNKRELWTASRTA